MSNDTFLGIKKVSCTDESAEKTAASESALNDLLCAIPKDSMNMQPYRSGGFINKDYDMGRVIIDLPIIKARKLLSALLNT